MTTSNHKAAGERRMTGTRPSSTRSRLADVTPTVELPANEDGRHGTATLVRTMMAR